MTIAYVPLYKQLSGNYTLIDTPVKAKGLNEGFDFDDIDISTGPTNAVVKQLAIEAEEKQIPAINAWMSYYDVEDYEINCTGDGIVIDVHNHLFLPNKGLSSFPKFRWGAVDGNVNFSGNKFTSFREFPRQIGGNCLANFNYIRNFKYAPFSCAHMYADRQKVRTDYPLTQAEYDSRKWIVAENKVYVISQAQYGELTSISPDHKTASVLLEGRTTPASFNTSDIDCLFDTLKLLS